jgi:serine/threonine protein kinase
MIAQQTITAQSSATSPPRERQNVAIKVLRRKYATAGLQEVALHRRLSRNGPGARYIVRLLDALFHDGHICQVYELHGVVAEAHLKQQPFSIAEVKLIARQLLEALTFLHRRGLIHTDIKPRNLLWCSSKQEMRLIDFDNADSHIRTGQLIATWAYSPPEMLIGTPMNWAVDMWSLGCTLFELLTGELLFDPWGICEQKYVEFSSSEGKGETSPSKDRLDEESEQLRPDTVLDGRYRLLRPLGRGRVSTTWEAEMIRHCPFTSPLPSEDEAKQIEQTYRKPKPPKKGYDIYEVALNYEHFLIIQQRLGAFPEHLANQGKYRHILYGSDGLLRFHPEISGQTVRDLLLAKNFDETAAAEIESFLLPMLRLDPAERATAADMLRNDWLNKV